MKPPRPQVNRRDLLGLRGAGRVLRGEPGGTQARAAAESTSLDLLKATRPAMGSFFEVRLGVNTPGAAELAGRALDLIDQLEEQLTVYRDDSEVSRLNQSAHLGPVRVEPGLFRLLETAQRIARETGGAYDVTAGALSEAWGFVRGPKRVPDAATLADARARTGDSLVRLDPTNLTVSFDRPGVTLNLGSIGKGHAVDRAAGIFREHWWPTGALVHGGRSSLYALGSPPGRFADRWPVALRNPFDPERPLGVIRLRNRGMGTSGTEFQRFEAGGRSFGHILDPRTGEPADGPASVTVLAPTAAEADALSTAFYLLGVDAAAAYVASHPGISALFVEARPSDGRPILTTLGLTADDFERA